MTRLGHQRPGVLPPQQGEYPAGPPKSFWKQTPPPAPPKAPTSPKKASGLLTGTVPDQFHSWEQRREDQQAEEAAFYQAAQARAFQETINARVAAAVEEALRKRDFEEQIEQAKRKSMEYMDDFSADDRRCARYEQRLCS